MKAKIQGIEVECTVEEFKQLTNATNTQKTDVTPKQKRAYKKRRKVVRQRVSWTPETIKKFKSLEAHYKTAGLIAKDRNVRIAAELGTTPLAVGRQRTVLKMTNKK